ncbi:glutathione S-transferase family protein [Ferrovibrio sp.]|uniref:glutathione S-transferase family protein n=1 Tax=Ferrovibrio sp. TaxID=1917215 RepID=UPI0025B86FE4|nr:glutathione S-transferase family protein [Ferrovibrio sp.]MBX3453930.1 glutathione S-transferase family protein [Ferrovibrio sp.]
MTSLKLFGRNLSPYTRRVAIAMTLLDIPHERDYLSVTTDPARGLQINPVGRVPALQLSPDETLIESAAILDYLMELAGPKSLIPARGKARRDCQRLMAIASGVLDKAVGAVYEVRRRPAEKVHEPWRQHLLNQANGGLKALEAAAAQIGPAHPWLLGEEFSLADITLAVTISFLRVMQPDLLADGAYPHLEKLTNACEAMAAFKAHPVETP